MKIKYKIVPNKNKDSEIRSGDRVKYIVMDEWGKKEGLKVGSTYIVDMNGLHGSSIVTLKGYTYLYSKSSFKKV